MNPLKNNRLVRGFTIIELLVALGVFSVIITVALGGFVSALRTERQASAFAGVNSNVSATLEGIMREARTGSNFCVNGINCASSSELSFINAKGETVTYCLVRVANDRGAVERTIGGSCGTGQRVTADNIDVRYFEFVLRGNQPDDGLPPRITVSIGARSSDATASSFMVNLQTTVSARMLDG